MRATAVFTGIIALCFVLFVADVICSDFGTWSEYRATVERQQAEINRLDARLLEYQQTVTDLKHAALAAK